MYEQQIKQYIDEKKDELLSELVSLMKIDSSLSEKKAEKPFGDGAALAMEKMAEIMESHGFEAKNYDNYVIACDLNDKEKAVDILAHLDVVPGGDGWSVTTPFVPVIKDGRIYGRGSSDDKGPAMAAFYAMRAIKELGIPVSKNARLILGGCEECGGGEIEYYYEREPHAPACFSPDADFPVINAERGNTTVCFSADVENGDKDITGFYFGEKRNVISSKGFFTVCGLTDDEIYNAIKAKAEQMQLDFSVKDGRVSVFGEGGHSSTPENARNPLTGALEMVKCLDLDGENTKKLSLLSDMFPFGVHHGESAGVDMEDDVSGRISASLNVLNTENGRFCGILDCRVPDCATKENCADILEKGFIACGFDVDKIGIREAHIVPADSPFVSTLLGSYEKITGKKGKPIAIGGGTYVHDIENGVAFGCAEEEFDNHMHGADEFMCLDTLFESVRIFADAITELCK